MNRRTCTNCGERSYSSCSGSHWDCPYCGKNLGRVPNDHDSLLNLDRALEGELVLEQARVLQQNKVPRTKL